MDPLYVQYSVGDIIEQHCFGMAHHARLVRVTARHKDVKNGRPGFDGFLAGCALEVWGYDTDVFRVVLKGGK